MARVFLNRRRSQQVHSSNFKGEGVALSFIGTDWLLDQWLYEPGEQAYLEYEQEVLVGYEQLLAQQNSQELTSIDQARQLGVEREWEWYSFFAQEEVNAPDHVLFYVDDSGELAYFTEEERAIIADWEKGEPYPFSHIEGHHLHLVSHHPDDLQLAADPDNVILATSPAHLEHLHGGNFRNPTREEYFLLDLTHEERLEETLAYNHDLLTYSIGEQMVASGLTSLSLFVSVGLVVEMFRLRRDPLPWRETKKRLWQKGISYAVLGGVLTGVGTGTKFVLESTFEQLPAEMADSAFFDILGLNSAFLAVTLTSAILKYQWDIRKGEDRRQAQAELKAMAMQAGAEFLAFQAVGLGLDMVFDLVADSFIPDPTGLFLITRSLYSIGKRYRNKKLTEECAIQCRELRMDHLLQKAEDALLASGVPAELIERYRQQYEEEQRYLVHKDGTLAVKGLSADTVYSKLESLGRSLKTWIKKWWKGW